MTIPFPKNLAPPVDVSIVIVDYEAFASLQELLASIREKTNDVSYEIIVVDNSRDDKSEMFTRRYPLVQYQWNTRNIGFGKAANIGIRRSAGRYVLLLNPDTCLYNNIALLLARFLDGHPAAGIVGSKILNRDGSIQFSCRSFPTYKAAFFNRYSLLTRVLPGNRHSNAYINPIGSHDKTGEVDWLSGSCMMVRKRAFDGVGLFDEDFFMYCEDVDLCRRMKSFGWKVVYYPEAVVYHTIGVSSRQNRIKSIAERHRSMWVYYKKHFKRQTITDIIVWSGIVVRLTVQVMLSTFARFVFN